MGSPPICALRVIADFFFSKKLDSGIVFSIISLEVHSLTHWLSNFGAFPIGVTGKLHFFYPLVNLLIRIPSWDSGVPSGITRGLVTTLHQLHLGGIADMVIEERYGEAPEYSYVAGKPKFSQAVNGVQTVHEYEATTLHDAIHKHSVISKANGELVIAQSRKTEEFIAADDTITFEQESIWDGTCVPKFFREEQSNILILAGAKIKMEGCIYPHVSQSFSGRSKVIFSFLQVQK